MVNPHISLNPQNSRISCAILRFHEDFCCEIHRFHEQSSDLAVDLFQLNPQTDLRIHSSALSESQCYDRGCHLHNLSWSHFPLRTVMCVQLKAGLSIGP